MAFAYLDSFCFNCSVVVLGSFPACVESFTFWLMSERLYLKVQFDITIIYYVYYYNITKYLFCYTVSSKRSSVHRHHT